MSNIEDSVNTLKSELEFDKDSIDDLHKRLDRLKAKQEKIINSFDSLVE